MSQREARGFLIEPKWLFWVRELQALAQTGLAFTKNAYDCQRYERLRELAAQIMAEHAGLEASRVEGLFSGQSGLCHAQS